MPCMKFSLWVYTSAVTVAAVAIYVMVGLLSNTYRIVLRNKPLPALSDSLVEHSWWVFLIPIPFIFASAWLCTKNNATPGRCLAFAAISTFVMVFLLGYTSVALAMPFCSFL